jgi:hypothetical protein
MARGRRRSALSRAQQHVERNTGAREESVTEGANVAKRAAGLARQEAETATVESGQHAGAVESAALEKTEVARHTQRAVESQALDGHRYRKRRSACLEKEPVGRVLETRSESKIAAEEPHAATTRQGSKRMRRSRSRQRALREATAGMLGGSDSTGTDNDGLSSINSSESRSRRRYHSRYRRHTEPNTSASLPLETNDDIPEASSLGFPLEHQSGRRRGASPQGPSSLPPETGGTLQGLLRHLGAGLSEILPSFGHGGFGGSSVPARLRRIASELRSLTTEGNTETDTVALMALLNELCEVLSIGVEDVILNFSFEQLVSPLVWILQNCPELPELLILAARALAYMVEISPSVGASIAQSRAVPALCGFLLHVEYIDLAEQCLQALERLSYNFPNHIVRSGGLRAILQHLDFFPTSIQRMASSAAANCCARVNDSALSQVEDALELLSHLLDSDDTRIREHGVTAYARLVANFSASSNAQEVLRRIANDGGAMEKLVAVLAAGEASLDKRHRGLVLSTLSSLASADEGLGTRMLTSPAQGGLGIGAILANLLGVASDAEESTSTGQLLGAADVHAVSLNRATQTETLIGSALMLVDALAPDRLLVQRLQTVLELNVRAPMHDQTSREGRRRAISAMKKTLFALESEQEIQSFSMQLVPTLGYVLYDPIDEDERASVMCMIERMLERVQDLGPLGELFVKEGVLHVLEQSAVETDAAQKILDRFGDTLRSSGRQRIRKLCELVERIKKGDHESLIALFPELEHCSVFEVQMCGLAGALDAYLSVQPGAASELATRYSHLLVAAIRAPGALRRLVRSLVAIFTNTERFQVVRNMAANGSVSAGIRLLSQPFRMQLQRGGGWSGSRLRDFPASLVLVEPLASAQTIEEFLYERVTGDAAELNELSDEPAFETGTDENGSDDSGAFEVATESTADTSDDEHAIFFDEDALSGSVESDEPGEHRARRRQAGSRPSLTGETALAAAEETASGSEEDSDEFSDLGETFDELGPEHGLENPNLSGSLPAVDIEFSDEVSGTGSPVREQEHSGRDSRRSAPETYAARAGRCAGAPCPSSEIDRGRRSRGIRLKRDGERRRARLSLCIRGHTLLPQETILHALVTTLGGQALGPRLWSETHALTYADCQSSRMGQVSSQPISNGDGKPGGHQFEGPFAEFELVQVAELQFQVPRSFHLNEVTVAQDVSSYLSLLGKLYWMNNHHAELHAWIQASRTQSGSTLDAAWSHNVHWPPADDPLVPEADIFASSSLENKLGAQLSDPLAVAAAALPPWCFIVPRVCQGLFSLQTRRLLVQVSSFGIARALSAVQTRADTQRQQHATASSSTGRSDLGAHTSGAEQEARIGRIQRQKVRVHRARLLESAELIMENFADQKALIEVEYFNEAGTGLGPTLEFYSMVSRELQRVDLKLWWEDSSKAAERERLLRSGKALPPELRERLCYVVSAGAGLYPAPIGPRERGAPVQERLQRFQFIGRFCAKAFLDGRLLDLRFSPAFWRLVRALAEARFLVSEGLNGHRAIFRAAKKRLDFSLRRLGEVDAELARSLHSIACMRDADACDIAALCLDWTLPGQPHIEMRPRGRSMTVSKDNLADYVRQVKEHVLFDCAARPAYAFLEGFQSICSIWALLGIFNPNEEVNVVLCGPDLHPWTEQELLSALRFDHGYTSENVAARNFVRALCSLNEDDRRHFLLFATGSPRLPMGGFHALLPPMTVVKRTPEAGLTPDECLPTVMTCTNYVKLPEYSSFEILLDRLLYTIREGQNSFDLS